MPDGSNLHIQWNLILPNIQNFPPIVWKYTLSPSAGKIHLETNNSAQLFLDDAPETNNWRDTSHEYHNLGVGQPFFQ